MKKAKTPSLLSGATDLLSMLSGLTSPKKSEPKGEEPPPQAEENGGKRFAVAPPEYLPNPYAHIIEKHDRIVKNILKNHGKDNE